MSEEMEVNDLIEKIFTESPKSSNSIQLSFISQIGVKDLFEFLLIFITNGSKILFKDIDDKVNLAKWTDIEYNILSRYSNSIGFNFILDRYNTEEEQLIDFKNMSYKKKVINNLTPLNTLKLPIKCQDDIFVFSFDYLQ
jgi:hypothetical protein